MGGGVVAEIVCPELHRFGRIVIIETAVRNDIYEQALCWHVDTVSLITGPARDENALFRAPRVEHSAAVWICACRIDAHLCIGSKSLTGVIL